ncbi:DUF397 domain-containing protein [Streptomyces pristinaespiralis]|jgi:hypothetical protein|uniref:DUF397 domain-containing protein n=2 Tax=Streptomyces pristinaespiralis TaxID=38300 RepID=B5HKN4_STRE2|nr:DUF397 domain-containing protein [Streptomyces pristinaespiralis]ALC21656.1 toxin [Streptomyces pristinaespiralis]EDY67395.1 conserved hypothetical protein [Streptomyces pristinaespiralis ATCC 25486]QMU15644.1 DUF397 domain-containing protein [Streptomyces pristinaespiralis]
MSTALEWFKSSYSSEQGGACLEVAYDWRKSTHSDGPGGACLEVATHPAAIHVRDSKNPGGPSLALAPAAWESFVSDLR